RSVQGRGEVIVGRRVGGLGFGGGVERGDGLRVLLFLRMQLADLDVGRGVSGVNREDFVEFGERFVVELFISERRRQRIMGVRAVGREFDSRARLFDRGARIV